MFRTSHIIHRRKMKANEQETLERNKRWIVMLLLVVAVTVRCMIIMHPHSGQGKPPMYGDYEAQRHWMEITTALPTSEWYVHGEDNDLQYWGLDYPPVTAYHSYVLGRVGKWIVPEAFELHTSRGHEEYNSKIFMKLSVLFSELLIYMPAAWYAVNGVAHVKAPTTAKIDALALLWLHPCVLLIDHGHFQYNTVCFGLALAAVGCIARHKYLLGSFFFTASFLFKQIGLYYAPAMFFGILSLCMSEGLSQGVGNVLTTGLVVVATVCLIFYPWLGDIEGAGHVVHRMFPFARGVFEDKVANVWCTLSLVVKLQKMLEVETMLKVATGCTLLTLIPGCLCCFRRSYSSGPWVAALVISASSFYLFSFQVHEKSVMFPIIMAALLPVATPKSRNSHHTARAVTVLTAVAMFSMFPLVVKDNLQVLYTALMLATVGACELICHSHKRWRLCWHFVLLTMLTAHVIHATVAPPAHLPDLWTMLITSLSCMYFLIASAALSFGQLRGSFDLAYNPKVE
eukprot:TRINITY_DN10931_c0_g1_i1.p1 TRINITY_DN10931_c0_g1~~TRINITY_DN10931_c0_g1_i1.p1  ORF type:complete len:513 (+),score=67.75 TRINITY_DN10931_c0_g1_i1:636-2174(+)